MSTGRPAAVIVLAAGEGTRMKSRATPKVLHELCGRSMVGHVLAAARGLDPGRLIVVVGHGRDKVVEHLSEVEPEALAVTQTEQNGTGHAVRVVIESVGALDGTVVVTNGDHPLLRAETLAELVATHETEGNAVTVLTTEIPDPTGYGRIVRGDGGEVTAIVEHKDADAAQRGITEINVGMYAFDGALLADALKRVTTDNASGEEYLTDVVAIVRRDGRRAGAYTAADWVETQGVNDRVQLAQARRQLNDRLLEAHMRMGATIVDPASTWVDVQVTIEPDAVVEPNTQLRGTTHLAAGVKVGPNCTLTNTSVGEDAVVVNTVSDAAEIGPQASVGPFTYLRPGTRLARKAKAGAYVEMKKAVVGEGAKVPHLTYVGDADIGAGSNIGAGTIFANYDGVAKHHTEIGEHVFVGSDSVLVAPVEIADGAYVAAGSVVVQAVQPGAMAVARGRQRNVGGWVERRRSGTPSAAAARRAQGQSGQQSE